MMERRFARFFINSVKDLITENHERDSLFEALRRYKSNQNLNQLLSVLRLLLNDPSRLELYDAMRPLILLRHQVEYSCCMPGSPRSKFRVVRLHRNVGEHMGFCLKGGFEHGVGIYVTDVTPGSQSERQGLKVGDEIIRVNGFTVSEALHEEVLNLIRMNDEVILKVTHVGMVPVKDDPMGVVKWEYVDEDRQDEVTQLRQREDLKLFVDTTGHSSFGCGIRSGPRNFPGIFIERIQPESLAHELGLETGDQIKEVNGTSFRRITHAEAILALKSSRQLIFVIRKKAGLRLFSGNSSTMQRTSRTTAGQPESYYQSHMSELSISSSTISEQRASPQGLATGIDPLQNVSENHQQELTYASNKKRAPSPPYTEHSNFSFMTSAEVHSKYDISKSQPRNAQGSQNDYEWSDNVPHEIYSKFSANVLDGRQLYCLAFKKSQDLGIAIEGGIGSPLGGKIVVAMVFENGVANQSGKIHIGDQLMMFNGQSLVDITEAAAERFLHNTDNISGDTVELLYCESTFINDVDSVTYF